MAKESAKSKKETKTAKPLAADAKRAERFCDVGDNWKKTFTKK